MADVMKRVEDNSYLERRGRVWWYNRRVPDPVRSPRYAQANQGVAWHDLRGAGAV